MQENLTCEEWLERCVAYHGHCCLGQILGLRLALKGLELAKANPRELVVIVENDRCIADAIQIVTGVRIGRRSMKLVDYGKMAATFFNCTTGRAFRVNVRKVDPKKASNPDAKRAALHMPDEELLLWREVKVSFRPDELPGKPRRTVNCTRCGEKVFDFKELDSSEGPLCRACAEGAYFEELG